MRVYAVIEPNWDSCDLIAVCEMEESAKIIADEHKAGAYVESVCWIPGVIQPKPKHPPEPCEATRAPEAIEDE